LAFFEFSSCRLRSALAGFGVPGKNSFLAVRLFSSLLYKGKKRGAFQESEKFLRTTDLKDVTDTISNRRKRRQRDFPDLVFVVAQ
jgi:hypothetical protein